MSHTGKGYDINQTFVIESAADAEPIFSACTALYATNILSCSGNTSIFLGNGVINFDGSLYTNNNLSATTVYASTYYSGGTNLFDIISDLQITGGSFNNNTETLTLNKQNGGQVIVTGFTDYYTTGATLIGNTVYFDRNDELSAYTLNLAAYSSDTYVTGVTFSDNQLIIARNDGVNLNTFINTFTGLTVNGLLKSSIISATTISATTFYGDGSYLTGISTQDTFVTGGTYSAGTAIFTNNTGGTFNVTGFYTGATDVFVTGGTYSTSASTLTLTNNTGGTFNVTGITTNTAFTGGTVTGATIFTNGLSSTTISATTYQNLPVTADTFTTAFTYSNNVFTINRNQGQSALTATINTMTGLTVNGSTALNGSITSNTLSGTTDRLVQVDSGGTISATQEIITAYISSGSTVATLLQNTSNWDINGNYTGSTITGTYQGQRYYDGNYFYEAVLDNMFIRLIRG